MAELKKCPFCGSDNITMMGKRENCFPWIRCECCGASTSAFETQEEAIEAWNNRATESEIRAKAIDEFAEKLKAELSEEIFSDEEKFKYARKEQELICAQNMTWKMAIRLADYVAEQLKERE